MQGENVQARRGNLAPGKRYKETLIICQTPLESEIETQAIMGQRVVGLSRGACEDRDHGKR